MSERTYTSPANKALHEAIDLELEGRPIYPKRSWFINAGTPYVDGQVKRAFENGYAAVVVSTDGSTRILHPETPARQAG